MRVCTHCRSLLRADASQCPADGAAAEYVDSLPKDTRLGAYKIERMLGEGGMGFVYEATHQVLNRRTAIKLLRPELATHEQVVTRFLNEAKAVNVINHQNIVNVYDYGDGLDGSVYFVMEFLEGETLDDLMRKRRPMQMPLLLHVFGQVAKALAAAHAKQIVHRDLKPANVYVISREDNPYFIKLLDFGIAQLRGIGAVQGLTIAGTVMGTPQYMSPEQVSGGLIDARSDVWAMGVMLYRAATGEAPFKGEEFAELADKILHYPPQPAEQLVSMPASLARLIGRCLERNIDARCQSLDELIAGLEQVKQECKLDDAAILAAVRADSGALGEVAPSAPGDRTRESLAGSLPRYQGAPNAGKRAARPGAAPARSKRGLYAALGVAILAGGAAGFAMLRNKEPAAKPPAEPAAAAAATAGSAGSAPAAPAAGARAPGARTIQDAFAAGDKAGARALAEQGLRDALASGTLQQQGFAVDAIGLVRVPAGAPILYEALKTSAPVQEKAAAALAELGLPTAAPKLKDALSAAGDNLRVSFAAAMFRLGDKTVRAALVEQHKLPRVRLIAAAALAEAADAAARPALIEALELSSPGGESWRIAVGGLLKLGDAKARAQLEGELAQSDPERMVAAAELLARADHAKARASLAQVVADPGFERRWEAALALARLGDRTMLDKVGEGLASGEAGDRKLALAICGVLAATGRYGAEIAKLATDDPDSSVRLTAEAVLLGL